MTDLLLDDTYELQIANGDLVLDTSDAQNQQLIIKSSKGNFLQFPTIGVGIDSYINANMQQYLPKLKKEIEVNFQLDGYQLVSIKLNGDTVDYVAKNKLN